METLSYEYVNDLKATPERIAKVERSISDRYEKHSRQVVFGHRCQMFREKCDMYLEWAKDAKATYLSLKDEDHPVAQQLAADHKEKCWKYFNKFTEVLKAYYEYKIG